jgi:hypothetical protein
VYVETYCTSSTTCLDECFLPLMPSTLSLCACTKFLLRAVGLESVLSLALSEKGGGEGPLCTDEAGNLQ